MQVLSMEIGLGWVVPYRLADAILNPKWTVEVFCGRVAKRMRRAQTIPPTAIRPKQNAPCRAGYQ